MYASGIRSETYGWSDQQIYLKRIPTGGETTMMLRDEWEEAVVEDQESQGDVRPRNRALSRSLRLPEEVPFALTQRDLALMRDVWEFRLLTTSQLETLRRADGDPATRFVSRLTLTRRLKGLYHHRYLRRIARPCASGSQEPVYVLDREGARALSLALERRQKGEAAEGEAPQVRSPLPSRLPKAQGLEHLLLINQARVAFTGAGNLPDCAERLQLIEWKTSDQARFAVQMAGTRGAGQSVTLLPDAGMVLRVTRGEKRSRHMAFLEADRGTEPLSALLSKARAYFAYWQSGGFAHDYAAPSGAGFWVLFTVPSKARGATLLKALQSVEGGLTMFRVALDSDLVPQRVAQTVWTEAGQGALVGPCQWIEEENR